MPTAPPIQIRSSPGREWEERRPELGCSPCVADRKKRSAEKIGREDRQRRLIEEETEGRSWGEELLWGILEHSQTRNRGERDEQIG